MAEICDADRGKYRVGNRSGQIGCPTAQVRRHWHSYGICLMFHSVVCVNIRTQPYRELCLAVKLVGDQLIGMTERLKQEEHKSEKYHLCDVACYKLDLIFIFLFQIINLILVIQFFWPVLEM